jgi:hypothetical protein
VNRSSSSLILRLISPGPTSMLALAVFKKGLPRIRGVLVRRNPELSLECPLLSPPGGRSTDPLAASTWL